MRKRLSMSSSWNEFSAREGPTVLLVDEDANDLERYSRILSVLGYDVRPIDSYAQAVYSLGHEHFDMVIVEQGSTEFEGRAVLRRAFEINRNVPVLVVTRTVDAGCCLQALDSGASEYVQKPLSTIEFEELISDYLGVPDGNDSVRMGMPARIRAA